MLIGSRGCNGQSEGRTQQGRCENSRPVGSHNCSSLRKFWGWADRCRGYARKLAESPENSCRSRRTSSEREKESRSTKDGPIVGEAKPAARTKAALRREAVLGEQMRRHFAEIPHDAEPGENFQRVIGNVNLPPVKALTRRSHEVMMIVVPAFTEREQRQQPVVLAGVRSLITTRPEKVRERIDGERVVPQQHR